MIQSIWRNYKGVLHSDGRLLIHRIKTKEDKTEDKRYKPVFVKAYDKEDKVTSFKVLCERLRFAQERERNNG